MFFTLRQTALDIDALSSIDVFYGTKFDYQNFNLKSPFINIYKEKENV